MSKANTDKLLAEAYDAHQAGRNEDAERLYKRVLRANPRDSDARNLLGLLYLHQQRFAEAARQIQRALALQPDNPQSLYNLGAALAGSGDPGRAAQHFRKASVADPKNPAVLKALSAALNDSGVLCTDPQEAIQLHGEALEADPANSQAAMNLGILLEQAGDFPAAAKSFQQALKAQPDFEDAHFHLAHLKQHRPTEEEISALIALFEKSGTKDKSLLAFAIAKSLEKLERYDEEFGWLLRAHELKAILEPYDTTRTATEFQQLKTRFSASSMAQHQRSGGSDLIFVVGMPRSGTSLAEQILASHSEVFGAGEVISVANLKLAPNSSEDDLRSLATEAEAIIRLGSDGEKVAVETTPVNFLHVGKINLLFPDAKIVHCDRDPLDTCLSIFQHPLSGNHAYAHRLETLGEYYRLQSELMGFWRDSVSNPMLELNYETLIGDFDRTVRDLLDFCGLDFDAGCLRFFETPRQVKTPSAEQVRQPIYSSSIGRWKRYAEELEPLRRALEI